MAEKARYTCPVCGYPGLDDPPENHVICPCCGTQFDYDDDAPTERGRLRRHAGLRSEWITSGMSWWSSARFAPPDWDARQQLERAGLMSLARPEGKEPPEG